MNNEDLFLKFKALPPKVYEWLSSAEVTYKIGDLNTRLNLRGNREGALASFVFRLVTQDIDPRDFVSTMAIELKISDVNAKIIAKILEEQIFHPIEEPLRNAGIDASPLHFTGEQIATPPPIAAANSEERVAVIAEARSTSARSNLDAHEIASGVPRNDENARPSLPTPHDGEEVKPALSTPYEIASDLPRNDEEVNGPMVIHTEKEEAKPIEQPMRSVFSVKIPPNKKQYTGPAPIAARIETANSEGQKPAVVASDPPVGGDAAIPNKIYEIASDLPRNDKKIRPPLRALSDIVSKEQGAKNEERQKLIEQIPDGPKIINVVAKMPLTKRVVHYSEWRTFI